MVSWHSSSATCTKLSCRRDSMLTSDFLRAATQRQSVETMTSVSSFESYSHRLSKWGPGGQSSDHDLTRSTELYPPPPPKSLTHNTRAPENMDSDSLWQKQLQWVSVRPHCFCLIFSTKEVSIFQSRAQYLPALLQNQTETEQAPSIIEWLPLLRIRYKPL